MNTMSEKVKKIMAAVIDANITKENAMEVLRVKYDWLYPYITNGVWDDHYGLYLKSKGALLQTKCGCVIKRDSKEHDECRCDDDGENWICAGCYSGEYDDDEEEKIGNCSDCPGYFQAGKDNCKTCDFDLNAYNKSAEEYCCCCRNPDEGLDGGCKCDCHTEIDTDEDEECDGTTEFLKQLARKVNVSPDDEYIKSAIKYITNST